MDASSHPRPLSITAKRALTASMVRTASDSPALVSQTVADTLDYTSSAVLAAVGIVDPATCRAILLSLWGDQ